MSLTLVIGNKNYSSWSLRPWLLLKQFRVAFAEIKLPLDTPEFHVQLKQYSPAGRVPVLIDDGLSVWDSLAICEHVNERHLDGRGWPVKAAARAQARSISAEMHSGFGALRTALPFNCSKRIATPMLDADVQLDIARIRAIWREARTQHAAHGDFLFGEFCIADAMYAPVAARFVSYTITLDEIELRYVETLRALPAMREWFAEAATEGIAALHEQNTA